MKIKVIIEEKHNFPTDLADKVNKWVAENEVRLIDVDIIDGNNRLFALIKYEDKVITGKKHELKKDGK